MQIITQEDVRFNTCRTLLHRLSPFCVARFNSLIFNFANLKEDKEGKYNLHIDGVPHVSWFRRKKEEFMEKLRPQARRQNRGIKL